MPQKKNPDALEVIRARMSHIIGNFVTVTSTLKGLPSAYNLDLQEITPKLWESLQKMDDSLRILTQIYPNLIINEVIFHHPKFAFITSTELANTLTRKYGIPFRTSHKLVGELIKLLVDQNMTIRDVSEQFLNNFVKKNLKLDLQIKLKDIEEAIDPKIFVETHAVTGGPSAKEVNRMIDNRITSLFSSNKWVATNRAQLITADQTLEKEIKDCLRS